MVWWLAAIFANVNIAVVEYLNRTGEFSSFGDALLRTAPCIIMAQYGLYRC